MNTYLTHSGTGFQYEESDINLKGLLSLLSKAKNTAKMLEEDGICLSDEDLTLEMLNESMDITEIIAECLNELTGLESFSSVSDDDGCHYVLFIDKAPWEYTQKEKELKKDDILSYFKNLLLNIVDNVEIEDLYIANYLND